MRAPVLALLLAAVAATAGGNDPPWAEDVESVEPKLASSFHAWGRPRVDAIERRRFLVTWAEAWERVGPDAGLSPRGVRQARRWSLAHACNESGAKAETSHDGDRGWGAWALGRDEVLDACAWRGVLDPRPRRTRDLPAWECRAERCWRNFRADATFATQVSVAYEGLLLRRNGLRPDVAAAVHFKGPTYTWRQYQSYVERLLLNYWTLWDDALPKRLDGTAGSGQASVLRTEGQPPTRRNRT